MLREQGIEIFAPYVGLKAETPNASRKSFLTKLTSASAIATSAFLSLPGISQASELYASSITKENILGATIGFTIGSAIGYVGLRTYALASTEDPREADIYDIFLPVTVCAGGIIGAAAGYLLTH